MEHLEKLVEPIISWYRTHQCAYPWRTDPTPYHIWLSEIMLQQTRIEAALPYYQRFIEELPDIAALAACDEDRLYKLWEGLGYYSRVRNLQKAARILVAENGGELPFTKAELLKLPGIGVYTAGAIASMGFGQPNAAVDGNVLRVLSRVTADARDVLSPALRAEATQALEAVYPTGQAAGDFTQGLMELGEQVCLPSGHIRCEVCPLAALCRANLENRQHEFPVRLAKKAKEIQELTVLLLYCKGDYALCKRDEKGLLSSLWQFPNYPGHLSNSEVAKRYGGRVTALPDARHVFTHKIWQMKGYRVEMTQQLDSFVWASKDEIKGKYALPSAFRPFMPYL